MNVGSLLTVDYMLRCTSAGGVAGSSQQMLSHMYAMALVLVLSLIFPVVTLNDVISHYGPHVYLLGSTGVCI